MNIIGNKETVRNVYKFADGDPTFDRFYDGICALLNGYPEESYDKLNSMLETEENINLYRYLVIAMIETERDPNEILEVVSAWMSCATKTNNGEELKLSTKLQEFFENVVAGTVDMREYSKKLLVD